MELKTDFSLSAKWEAYLQTQIGVGQSPKIYGIEQSRWSLEDLLGVYSYLKIKSKSCLWK